MYTYEYEYTEGKRVMFFWLSFSRIIFKSTQSQVRKSKIKEKRKEKITAFLSARLVCFLQHWGKEKHQKSRMKEKKIHIRIEWDLKQDQKNKSSSKFLAEFHTSSKKSTFFFKFLTEFHTFLKKSTFFSNSWQNPTSFWKNQDFFSLKKIFHREKRKHTSLRQEKPWWFCWLTSGRPGNTDSSRRSPPAAATAANTRRTPPGDGTARRACPAAGPDRWCTSFGPPRPSPHAGTPPWRSPPRPATSPARDPRLSAPRCSRFGAVYSPKCHSSSSNSNCWPADQRKRTWRTRRARWPTWHWTTRRTIGWNGQGVARTAVAQRLGWFEWPEVMRTDCRVMGMKWRGRRVGSRDAGWCGWSGKARKWAGSRRDAVGMRRTRSGVAVGRQDEVGGIQSGRVDCWRWNYWNPNQKRCRSWRRKTATPFSATVLPWQTSFPSQTNQWRILGNAGWIGRAEEYEIESRSGSGGSEAKRVASSGDSPWRSGSKITMKWRGWKGSRGWRGSRGGWSGWRGGRGWSGWKTRNKVRSMQNASRRSFTCAFVERKERALQQLGNLDCAHCIFNFRLEKKILTSWCCVLLQLW